MTRALVFASFIAQAVSLGAGGSQVCGFMPPPGVSTRREHMPLRPGLAPRDETPIGLGLSSWGHDTFRHTLTRMLAKARRGDKGKGKGRNEGTMRRGRFSRYQHPSRQEEGGDSMKAQSVLPSQLRARGGGVEEGEVEGTWGPYAGLLRAHNILPSMFVCMLGAWIGTHDMRHTLLNPTVLLVAVISALVAVGSCVLNDYFDLRIDAINKPERSLVQGTVRPSVALLIGSSLLTAAFAAASPALIANPILRRIIRSAVLAVTLYTPVFKPVPFLKNAVVAGVTSASLLLGGLASGASLQALSLPAILVFLAVLHREVLMDIDDVDGDTQCGIWTVPRLLGKPGALVSAASLLASGVLAVVYQLLQQPQPQGLIAGGLVLAAGLATCAYDVGVVRKNFQHEHLTKVINLSIVPMAVALFIMGFGTININA